MREMLFHMVLGPDLDPDFDAPFSMSGLTPGRYGDDWIGLDADRAAKVQAVMREPGPKEHETPGECGVCQVMAEEGAVPIMLSEDAIRDVFGAEQLAALERYLEADWA